MNDNALLQELSKLVRKVERENLRLSKRAGILIRAVPREQLKKAAPAITQDTRLKQLRLFRGGWVSLRQLVDRARMKK